MREGVNGRDVPRWPLFFLRSMVPCALSPVLAFRGHLGVKIKRLRWTLSWSIDRIWSFIICFFPVPSGAPRQPSARVVNSSAIVVRWSPPLQKDQDGRLEGYVVNYLKVDDLGNQLYPRPDLQIDHTARGDLVWLLMLLYIVRTVRLLIYYELNCERVGFFFKNVFQAGRPAWLNFRVKRATFTSPINSWGEKKPRLSPVSLTFFHPRSRMFVWPLLLRWPTKKYGLFCSLVKGLLLSLEISASFR